MTRLILSKVFRSLISLLVITFIPIIPLRGQAQSDATNQIIHVPRYQGSVKELLHQIEENEGVKFSYSSQVSLNFEVNFSQEEMKLMEFLKILFKDKGIGYKINGQKIILYAVEKLNVNSSELNQTLRGTIYDVDTKMPLIGATVVIIGSDPVKGTVTNLSGEFRFTLVSIGRFSLQVNYLGYNPEIISDVVINSGKETVLEIGIKEMAVKIDEVVVNPQQKKGRASNEMALLSARSISAEETKRYAGGGDDPATILTYYAGVTSSQNGNNDLIIRGNSPKYIQWRLEGFEILPPSHYTDQNSTAGGFSALNNKLLSSSDFYTGAFPSEYGNAISGIYNVQLRPGNNEKFEASVGVGIMGTEVTFEGPFKKGYRGSYLFNYRYFTIGLIQDIGLVDLEGTYTSFQDATLKIVLPTKKAGKFTLVGIGGLNSLLNEAVTPQIWSTPGDNGMKPEIVEDFHQKNWQGNLGLSHLFSINDKSYIKSTLAYSGRIINESVYEWDLVNVPDSSGGQVNETINERLNYDSQFSTSVYRLSSVYNNKINTKNKIRLGSEYSLNYVNTDQSRLNYYGTSRIQLLEFDGYINILKNYISWKHDFNNSFSLVSGIHNMNVFMIRQSTIEPRIAFSWSMNSKTTMHFGYGNHSTLERIHNYFTRVEMPDGTITEPNRNLSLLRANHFVVGYEKQFNKNLSAKLEVYYQHLYDLPVEDDNSSSYATINEGSAYNYVPLVNEGTGKNFGLELTVERFFSNQYYYLFTASVFDSKYTAKDGVERNTKFNSNYLVNVLFGKEFDKIGKKDNKTLSVNLKYYLNGGQRYIPLLRDESGQLAVDPENNRFWDYRKIYNNKMDLIYSFTLSLSYKINLSKSTHELFIDLPNFTNYRGKMSEYFDTNEPGNIGYVKQMEFLANIMYRLYF